MSITICDLLILFSVCKNRLRWFLEAWATWPQLSPNQATNSFFLDVTVVLMVLDVYFFPSSAHLSFMQQCWLACRSVQQLPSLIRCLASSNRAGGMGVLAGSCPWHKARTRNRCLGGGTLPDLYGIWDTVRTPERWSQEMRGRDVYKETQRGEAKTDQENCQFLFSLLLLCQQLNLCYAYTVLLYVDAPAHTNLS